MSDYVLFVVAPCAAALVLLVGVMARVGFSTTNTNQPTSVSSTADRADRRRRRVLTIGWLGLCAGHIGMFTAPDLLRAWNQELPRLIALELVLFALGLIALASLLRVDRSAARGATAEGRQTSSGPIDAAFFGLLLVAVTTGLIMAARYRWASAWSIVVLTPYLRSLLGLRPDLELVAMLPYLVKLHVLAGIVLIGVFPFTRFAGALSDAVQRAIGRSIAPLRAALAHRSRQVSEAGRNLIWPEEEER